MPEVAPNLSDIKQGDPKTKSVWDVLNSSFVLFLMSSVVLGGITFSYQSYDIHRKAVEERTSRIGHLGTEVRYRVDTISAMVQPGFTYTTFYNSHGALLGAIGNKDPDDTLVGEYSSIFPEFENRNLISLLWELQDLERKTNKKFSLNNAIEADHYLSVSWNENVELTDAVAHGHHDSMWHFKQPQQMDEFNRHLQIIRTTIPADTDD